MCFCLLTCLPTSPPSEHQLQATLYEHGGMANVFGRVTASSDQQVIPFKKRWLRSKYYLVRFAFWFKSDRQNPKWVLTNLEQQNFLIWKKITSRHTRHTDIRGTQGRLKILDFNIGIYQGPRHLACIHYPDTMHSLGVRLATE